MSGTSVATAVATGTLAQLWSARPNVDGADIRAVVTSLGSRNAPVPQTLDPHAVLMALDRKRATATAASSIAERGRMNCASSQGVTIMSNGNEPPRVSAHNGDPNAMLRQAVIPASGSSGCACGAQGGQCTCEHDGSSPSRPVYVLGTVDIKFPDQSISEELETVARTARIEEQRPNESLRHYYHRFLSVRTADGRTLMARYVARQVCWVLKVEGQIAYYLSLRDLDDLPDLISCLKRAEPGDHQQPEDDPEDYDQGENHKQEHHDLDLFVGASSLIGVGLCPGVTAPVLAVDQLCSFRRKDILGWCKKAPPRKRPRGNATATTGERDAN
jgi:hypothetical protein